MAHWGTPQQPTHTCPVLSSLTVPGDVRTHAHSSLGLLGTSQLQLLLAFMLLLMGSASSTEVCCSTLLPLSRQDSPWGKWALMGLHPPELQQSLPAECQGLRPSQGPAGHPGSCMLRVSVNELEPSTASSERICVPFLLNAFVIKAGQCRSALTSRTAMQGQTRLKGSDADNAADCGAVP